MPIDLDTFTKHATVPNALCLAGGIFVLKYYDYLWWPIQSWQSPLRHLNGPPNDSFFLGHLLKLNKEVVKSTHEEWVSKYGKTIRFRGILGVRFFVELS